MKRAVLVLALACTAVTTACGGNNGPTGPTANPPRISRTRFLAFGDSFTAGEVTTPIAAAPALAHKMIVVPASSYPSVLQGQLQSTYTTQSGSIAVINSGQPSERILEGLGRFPDTFAASRADVVLLMEGVNGLPQVGPDISAGVMRIMVQEAKNGRARVFVGSMIPQVPSRPRGNTPVSELLAYNNTLQIMSTQEGITYVDLYNTMLADATTLIGSDGLHPNEAGYRRIAELFFAAIKTELQER
jgi:lysophospholipase L1-like esterase